MMDAVENLIQRLEPHLTEVENELRTVNANYRSWPLMDNALQVLLIVCAYLAFVWAGPKFMSSRKPYDLKHIILAYNLFQVLFSIIIFIMAVNANGIRSLWRHLSLQENRTRLPITFSVLQAEWWYLVAKLTELLDTVFFILKKKDRQVTFLHVYHHASVCVTVWVLYRYVPGEQEIVIGLLNSVIHIFMYLYYFLSALGPSYQKYLWWKKYITQMQLIQFVLMGLYTASTLIFQNDLLKTPSYVLLATAAIFLALFTNFYTHAYKKKNI